MPSGLLIVQSPSASFKVDDWPVFQGYGKCERRDWESCSPQFLCHSNARLIVVDAAACTQAAMSFFKMLANHSVQAPIFAILSRTMDQDLLRTVTEVVDDFLFWPAQKEELEFRLSRMLGPQLSDSEKVQATLMSELGLANLLGRHPSFLLVLQQLQLFARSEAPVLITGETGTGKELFAHALHSVSERRSGPFIPLDCGSMPEHLAEDELFGHHRGAFTDARTDRKGMAAMADGGTLFMDEVDSLSLGNQAKFLRFLQEGTFRALGSDRLSRTRVRAIAATNGSIEEKVQQRLFRNDLYFRLNVLRLRLPPLRERPGDVALLATHFLRRECESSFGGRIKIFSRGALRKLESYSWPGNVRELQNAVQRACLCCPGTQILADHVTLCGQDLDSGTQKILPVGFRSAKQQAMEEFERTYLRDLLTRHGGNITRAAREAGKERRALGKLAKKYGILSRSA